jgi:hypothetical protein
VVWLPWLSLTTSSGMTPEEISSITAAYEQALHNLCVKDRDDPLTAMIAKKIIKIAQSGVRPRRRSRIWRSRNSKCGKAALAVSGRPANFAKVQAKAVIAAKGHRQRTI